MLEEQFEEQDNLIALFFETKIQDAKQERKSLLEEQKKNQEQEKEELKRDIYKKLMHALLNKYSTNDLSGDISIKSSYSKDENIPLYGAEKAIEAFKEQGVSLSITSVTEEEEDRRHQYTFWWKFGYEFSVD